MKCKWLSIVNMIRFSSISFIHNIKSKRKPKSIFNLYTLNKSKRNVNQTYPIYEPRLKQMKHFIIYKGSKLYNMIPDDIKESKKYHLVKN